MKIVHLTDTYAPVVGGIERQVERLAALQARQGHDVVVVTRQPEGGRAAGRRNGVLVRRPPRPVAWGRALPLHVDDMDADVFHAHLSVLSPGAMRAAALVHGVGLPLAVTVHSMWPTTAFSRSLVRLAGLDTDRVGWSAVSSVAARRVGLALSGRRVDVLPNAVDVDWWSGPDRDRTGHTVTAVLVGRLARRKRVVPLLRALARDWPAGLRVVVVGDGPRRVGVARVAGRAGVAGRLELRGGLDAERIRRLLHTEADVFVAPSALESFGIAALEARAAGVPVLAREQTGVTDFIDHGVDGWLAGSDRGLADALRALVADPSRIRAARAAAHAARPGIDEVFAVRATHDLYARAIAGVGRRQPARERGPGAAVREAGDATTTR